jgi:hypothetical protein
MMQQLLPILPAPTLPEDQDLVLQALKAFRRLTLSARYGGLSQEVKLAAAALNAFERMAAAQRE